MSNEIHTMIGRIDERTELMLMSNEIHTMIGRIDERTELMLKSMADFKKSADDHGLRIQSLERTRSYGMGIAGTIGFFASFLWSKISIALGFHG